MCAQGPTSVQHETTLVIPVGFICVTVEPRYNEVPRDWENVFVIWRVRYKGNPIITNLWENDQNLRYIGV